MFSSLCIKNMEPITNFKEDVAQLYFYIYESYWFFNKKKVIKLKKKESTKGFEENKIHQ